MEPSPILRAERPDDESFIYQLFVETRLAEIAPLLWTQSQQAAFLHHQLKLQTTHYRTHYPTGAFSIIQLDNCPIGRLYVGRESHEIWVIDITLAAEYRNRGIGGSLLRALLAEATTTGQAVKLHVERSNPAWRLYQRLGFREFQDQGIYLEMEWRTPMRTVTGSIEY